MTPFRFEHEFRGTVDGFWRVFFEAACMKDQYDRVGVREFDVEVLRDQPDRLVRVVRVIPARELPAMVRKLTGASFGYTETTTYFTNEGYAETEVVTSSLAKRISIQGRTTVEPSGPGHVLRVFAGELDVDVKLIGARIERTVLDDMTRSYANGAEITQGWLDKQQ